MAVVKKLGLTAACLLLLLTHAVAAPQNVTSTSVLDSMSLDDLDEQLQVGQIHVCHT
jgi:hypothetical protein